MTIRFARISPPSWEAVCRLTYTPLASKAAACAGLRMVVPTTGDSKLGLATLLNESGKKTGLDAPLSRRGPQAGDSDSKVQLASAWLMVPTNEPLAAGSTGAAASLMKQAYAVKRPAASKRLEKRRAMQNVVQGAALGNTMAGHPGGTPQCLGNGYSEGELAETTGLGTALLALPQRSRRSPPGLLFAAGS